MGGSDSSSVGVALLQFFLLCLLLPLLLLCLFLRLPFHPRRTTLQWRVRGLPVSPPMLGAFYEWGVDQSDGITKGGIVIDEEEEEEQRRQQADGQQQRQQQMEAGRGGASHGYIQPSEAGAQRAEPGRDRLVDSSALRSEDGAAGGSSGSRSGGHFTSVSSVQVTPYDPTDPIDVLPFSQPASSSSSPSSPSSSSFPFTPSPLRNEWCPRVRWPPAPYQRSMMLDFVQLILAAVAVSVDQWMGTTGELATVVWGNWQWREAAGKQGYFSLAPLTPHTYDCAFFSSSSTSSSDDDHRLSVYLSSASDCLFILRICGFLVYLLGVAYALLIAARCYTHLYVSLRNVQWMHAQRRRRGGSSSSSRGRGRGSGHQIVETEEQPVEEKEAAGPESVAEGLDEEVEASSTAADDELSVSHRGICGCHSSLVRWFLHIRFLRLYTLNLFLLPLTLFRFVQLGLALSGSGLGPSFSSAPHSSLLLLCLCAPLELMAAWSETKHMAVIVQVREARAAAAAAEENRRQRQSRRNGSRSTRRTDSNAEQEEQKHPPSTLPPSTNAAPSSLLAAHLASSRLSHSLALQSPLAQGVLSPEDLEAEEENQWERTDREVERDTGARNGSSSSGGGGSGSGGGREGGGWDVFGDKGGSRRVRHHSEFRDLTGGDPTTTTSGAAASSPAASLPPSSSTAAGGSSSSLPPYSSYSLPRPPPPPSSSFSLPPPLPPPPTAVAAAAAPTVLSMAMTAMHTQQRDGGS